jgi:integrase/recombinase XerD
MNKIPTTKLELDQRYKKEDKKREFPLRLRITHERTQHYIPTGFKFTTKDWAKKKSDRPVELGELETKAKKIIEKLNPFSIEAFKKKFNDKYSSDTLKDYFSKTSEDLRKGNKIKSAITFESACSSFERFREGLHLNHITVSLLNEYETWMTEEQHNSLTTIGIHVRALRRILNEAIAAKDFQRDDYPFGKYGYKVPEGKDKKQFISWDQFIALTDYEPEEKKQQYAKAIWLVCYYASGRNPTDIFRMKWSNIDEKKKTIEFEHRQKTKDTAPDQQPVVVTIHDDLQAIIDKYAQKKKADEDDGYVFPVLTKGMTEEQIIVTVEKEIRRVNLKLADIAKTLKFNCKSFTLGVARCSMANFLQDAEIPVEKISKIMGHKNIKTTYKYVNSMKKTYATELDIIRPVAKKIPTNLKVV